MLAIKNLQLCKTGFVSLLPLLMRIWQFLYAPREGRQPTDGYDTGADLLLQGTPGRKKSKGGLADIMNVGNPGAEDYIGGKRASFFSTSRNAGETCRCW